MYKLVGVWLNISGHSPRTRLPAKLSGCKRTAGCQALTRLGRRQKRWLLGWISLVPHRS